MNEKTKIKGQLGLYLQWPLFLGILVILFLYPGIICGKFYQIRQKFLSFICIKKNCGYDILETGKQKNSLVAVYLFDETEVLKYRQEIHSKTDA